MEAVLGLIATGERKPDQCWDLSKKPLAFSALTCMLSLHGQGWKPPHLFVERPGDLQRSALSNPSPGVKVGLHLLRHSTPTPAGESFLFALT